MVIACDWHFHIVALKHFDASNIPKTVCACMAFVRYSQICLVVLLAFGCACVCVCVSKNCVRQFAYEKFLGFSIDRIKCENRREKNDRKTPKSMWTVVIRILDDIFINDLYKWIRKCCDSFCNETLNILYRFDVSCVCVCARVLSHLCISAYVISPVARFLLGRAVYTIHTYVYNVVCINSLSSFNIGVFVHE